MLKSRQSTLRRVDYFDDFFSVQVLENGGCHQNFQHIVYQVSVLQCAELAGCESELGFFFELFSSVYLSFLLFGVQGVETSCKLCIGAFNFLKL